MEGAVLIVTAKDIPENGKNDFMVGVGGSYPELVKSTDALYQLIICQQVLATDTSEYAGQAVAIAIADTFQHAHQMSRAVSIKYESLGKPILSIQDAIAAGSYYNQNPNFVTIGNVDGNYMSYV